MKIIKEGKLPPAPIYQHTCTKCETVYEYEFSDLHYWGEFRGNGHYTIKCPMCNDIHFHAAISRME